MYNSIQQFNENGIKNLEKTFMDFSQDLTKFAEMIEGVSREIVQLGLNMVAEELEYYDEQLRQNRHMRVEWHIVKWDEISYQKAGNTLCLSGEQISRETVIKYTIYVFLLQRYRQKRKPFHIYILMPMKNM